MENFAHIHPSPHFRVAIGSIMNEALMDRLASECDMIYHLASAVDVRVIVNRTVEVFERRVLGSEVGLKTANRYKRKVLMTSTSEVYDKINKVPFNETKLFTQKKSSAGSRG